MGRHGENIRKRKDGRWEGRYLTYCEEKQKPIYRSVYGKSYGEVKEKLIVRKNLLQKDLQITDPGTNAENQFITNSIMISDIAVKWISEVKQKRKRSTYVKYDFIYRTYIEQTFAGIKVSEVTSLSVKEKIPENLSDSIQKSIYCVLNQILKFASGQYSIITPKLQRSVSTFRNKPIKSLAWREQRDLICVLYKDMDLYKLAILTCLFTGLRIGELCALKWSDLDCHNRILTVNRTVQRLYAEGYKTKTVLLETAPKSEYSRREIPVSETVFALLIRFYGSGEYIFGKDKPMEPRTLQNHFKDVLKEAELEDKNFHILRHTFSTNCIESGIDVKSLSAILGHSDVQITLNRYVHPSMSVKRSYIDTLSKFYGQIYGQGEEKMTGLPVF